MLFTENMKNEINLIIDEDKEKYFNSLEKTIEQSYDNIKRKYLTKNPFSFCINYFKRESKTESKIIKFYNVKESFFISLLRPLAAFLPFLNIITFCVTLTVIIDGSATFDKIFHLSTFFTGFSFSFFATIYTILRYGSISNLINILKKGNKQDFINDVKKDFDEEFYHQPISNKLMKYLSQNISSEILATFWTNNRQDVTYYDVLNFIDNQEKYYKNKMIIESFKDNEDNKKEEDRLEKSIVSIK